MTRGAHRVRRGHGGRIACYQAMLGLFSAAYPVWRAIASCRLTHRMPPADEWFRKAGMNSPRLGLSKGTKTWEAIVMVELELATTEQILEELAKRPIQFVFVSMFDRGNDHLSGYLAHSPRMDGGDALLMLRRAEEFFEEPIDGQHQDGESS
jgi:hypothetical protein